MRNGNPNLAADMLAPPAFNKSPMQPGYQNPYGFGAQRTAGQLAPQPISRAGMYNSSVTAQTPQTPQMPPMSQLTPYNLPPRPQNSGYLGARPRFPQMGLAAVTQAFQKQMAARMAQGFVPEHGGRVGASALSGY